PTRIKQALTDENWYVRGEAARALGMLGDKSASALLLPLLKDQSWFVRSAALTAIASLGAPSEAQTARELVDSPDAYVRARASITLADPTVLIQALGDR